MATFTVINTDDSGDGSLRAAIEAANLTNAADTIVFAAGIAGQTIVLTSGALYITKDITINGDINDDRKADITISGGDTSRIFHHSGNGTDTNLQSLTITDG